VPTSRAVAAGAMAMDFSEEYVKMCERATPVQESWRPRRGDFALWDGRRVEEPSPVLIYNVDDELLHVVTLRRGTYHVLTRNDLIWLPRQDQLQELYHSGHKWAPVPCLEWQYIAPDIWGAEKFSPLSIDRTQYWRQFKTYEQLWLALLMWLKHNQVWNGEQWHVTKVMKMKEVEKKYDIVLDNTIYAATSEGLLCITPDRKERAAENQAVISMKKQTVYPIHVEVVFRAEDEVELTLFINHLLQFDWADRIHIRRIVPLSWLKHGVPREEYENCKMSREE